MTVTVSMMIYLFLMNCAAIFHQLIKKKEKKVQWSQNKHENLAYISHFISGTMLKNYANI